MRIFFGTACVLLTIGFAACDSSMRVGELREDFADGGPLLPVPPVAAPEPETWRPLGPAVPCSIYAMAQTRSDTVWLGCNGGGIYLYDGVTARLAFSVDDTSIVSLLAVAPDGQVWAAAQSGFGAKATTTLLHFDGALWQRVPGPSTRVTSLAGASAHGVWLTTDTTIFRLVDGVLQTSFSAPEGAFRGCAFDGKRGYCVGTEGLAVAWDGKSWGPLGGVPWSTKAEVLGVELSPFDDSAELFYGEPIEHPNGDLECRVARLSGTFTPLAAALPCFADFDVARKRTGQAVVNGKERFLLAPQAQYGGTLVFDPDAGTVQPLCGPVLAFAQGLANTRAGGLDGLLATIVGSGGSQLALSGASGASMTFDDLSVAPDGAAWARVEDPTVCGSSSSSLVRFEDDATWRPVAAPLGAQSGRGLAATARDRAYTIDIGRKVLLEYTAGAWLDRPRVEDGWSLWATRVNDVWVGGLNEHFGHFDGTTYRVEQPPGRMRQVEQIVAVDSDVWLVAQGVTAADADVHLVHQTGGKIVEWNLGLERVRVSALDATHAWRSGAPAHVWDGVSWSPLPFDASNIWARANSEVYVTERGDISRWDGEHLVRMHHGFIPITAIAGSKDRAYAVGRGSLTLALGHWPVKTR